MRDPTDLFSMVRWRVPRSKMDVNPTGVMSSNGFGVENHGKIPKKLEKIGAKGNEIHPKETNMTGWKIKHE